MVTSFLLVFALPSMTVASFFLLFDRHLGTHFFQAANGGDPLLWQHLFWSFGHPEVYILILPAFGMISEIVPVFSGKPIFGYTFVAWSGVAIGFLSFTVWAHHMFAVGLPTMAQAFFASTTTLIAIPTAVKIFNWVGTIYGGRLRFYTPMLFALGFMAMFLIGGLNGAALAVVPFDYQVTDTYFVVSHIHYVLFGGAALGIFAGIYYWWPKFFGRMLNERLGKIQFWLLLIGLNLAFFPMHILGLLGMPRRQYTFAPGLGWDELNLISTIGAFMIGLGTLVFIWNCHRHLPPAGDEPAPTRGMASRWSGRPPRRRHRRTSRRFPSCAVGVRCGIRSILKIPTGGARTSSGALESNHGQGDAWNNRDARERARSGRADRRWSEPEQHLRPGRDGAGSARADGCARRAAATGEPGRLLGADLSAGRPRRAGLHRAGVERRIRADSPSG